MLALFKLGKKARLTYEFHDFLPQFHKRKIFADLDFLVLGDSLSQAEQWCNDSKLACISGLIGQPVIFWKVKILC